MPSIFPRTEPTRSIFTPFRARKLSALIFSVTLCSLPAKAQSSLPPPATPPSPTRQQAAQLSAGTITGRIVDPSGAAIGGAHISLARPGRPAIREIVAAADGQFMYAGIDAGIYQLSISAPGFATNVVAVTLHPSEAYVVPPITLALATEDTEVQVVLPRAEVAEEEVKEEEKQRVLGVVPNFYISYVPNAAPLNTKQKFDLAWKTSTDPFTFLLTGVFAGVEQSQNSFSGYGQGAQGFGKRYGASYADAVAGTYIGGAILPSLLKQDPRYFYKGAGTTRSRIFYAIANAVICKGDNGRWQPNYSNVLGSLAAGGISNLYYPAADRNGAALTFEATALGIGASAAANLLQEFVIRKFTPSQANHASPKP